MVAQHSHVRTFVRIILKITMRMIFIFLATLFSNSLKAQCSGVYAFWEHTYLNNRIVPECTPVTFNVTACNFNYYSISTEMIINHGEDAFTYLQSGGLQPCGVTNGLKSMCSDFTLDAYECRTVTFVVQVKSGDFIRVNGYFNINNGNCNVGLNEINFAPAKVDVIGQTGQTTYLSQNPNIDPNFPIQRLLIKGNVIFDIDMNIASTSLSSLSFIAMDENAKITIPANHSLNLYGSDIHGCIRRWNSVDIEGGAEFFALPYNLNLDKYSTIKDGEDAIILRDNASINIRGTKFIDNFRSIYAPTTGSANTSFSPMRQCYFEGSGIMLPAAGSGLVNPIIAYPYVGIHVENVNNLIIAPGENWYTSTASVTSRAFFSNMANGIIAKNSIIHVGGVLFQNILSQYGTSSYPLPYNGNAIYSYGTGYWTVLNASNYNGGYAPTENEFYNCGHAINTSNTNIVVATDNIITNPYNSNNNGIRMENTNGGWRINNNNITAASGIITANSSPFTTSIYINSISDNLIYSQGGFISGGIICNENLTNYGMNIKRNTLQSSTLFGFYLNGVNNSKITENYSESFISSGYDYGIVGSNALTLSCNTASSNSSTNSRRGMYFYNTPYSDISCNTTSFSGYGLSVNGACTNAQLKGNRMSQHNYGLYYGTSTQTGPQNHAGNLWQSGFNSSGAFHAGGAVEAASSRYTISSSSTPLNPVTFSPSGWFVPDSGTPYTCQATTDCPNVYSLVANNPSGGGNPLNELLTTKANVLNVRGSEAVTPEMKWMMQYHLYRHLSDNADEMARDNSLKDFYRNASNTSIGKFYKIEKTFKMAHDVAKASKKRLEDNTLKHNDLMEQYRKLDTFAFMSKRDRDKTVNGQKMNQIRTEMNKIVQANQADLKQIEKEKKAILRGSIQADIATVGVTLKPEINEKSVNEIYLDVMLNDKTLLTESQKRTITDIANQCPKVGGDAVFKARTLYQMIESKLFIDDDKNCEQIASLANNNIETIKASIQTKTFGVYPNPAKDFIQLEAKNLEENGEWLIVNSLGKVVTRYQNARVNADIKDLPTGVYIVLYRLEGIEQYKSKFVKSN